MKEIERAARSEAYRFRNERGQIIGHTSVPVNDDQALEYAAQLAMEYDFQLVFIERRRYIQYPFSVEWINLLLFWDSEQFDWVAA